MRTLVKLGLAAGAAWGGYEGILWWRKKNSFTPLVQGHGYTVVLSYSGAGIGGPLSSSQVQSYLDAGPGGVGQLAVSATSTDPTKKTITYTFGAMSSMNGTAAVLAPSTFPAAFGTLSVQLVQDTGSIPVTPAVAAAPAAAG